MKKSKPIALPAGLSQQVIDWCKPHKANPARFIAFAVEHWLDAVDDDGNAACALEASGGNWKPFERRYDRDLALCRRISAAIRKADSKAAA